MTRLLFIFTLISHLFISCGTSYNFVPMNRMKKGDVFTGVHLSYSFNRLNDFGFQFSWYYAVSDKNLLGINFYQFLIPSNISYIYQKKNLKSIRQYQLHLKNIYLKNIYNPDIEVGYANINFGNNIEHCFKTGIGFYFNPDTRNYYFLSTHIIGMLPTFGYSIQTNNLRFNTTLNFGITKYIVSNIKSINSKIDSSEKVIKLEKSKIININKIDRDKYFASGWEIELVDDKILHIKTRFPTYSPNPGGYYLMTRNQFLSSDKSYNYCVYYEDTKNDTISHPIILELNMEAILNKYSHTGILLLQEEKELVKKSIENTKYIPNDIQIDFGYINNK